MSQILGLKKGLTYGPVDSRRLGRSLGINILPRDAGSPEVFRRYSRPCPGVDLETITRGLTELAGTAPITIQALFTSGKNGNLAPDNLNEWRARLLTIRPALVQIYTLARGYPDADIAPATPEELSEIKAMLDRAGVPSQVF